MLNVERENLSETEDFCFSSWWLAVLFTIKISDWLSKWAPFGLVFSFPEGKQPPRTSAQATVRSYLREPLRGQQTDQCVRNLYTCQQLILRLWSRPRQQVSVERCPDPMISNKPVDVCERVFALEEVIRTRESLLTCCYSFLYRFCQSRGYVRASGWTTQEPAGGSTLASINGEVVERAADPNMQVFATIVCETE